MALYYIIGYIYKVVSDVRMISLGFIWKCGFSW